MTTEYKAYEANPLGYLKMAAKLANRPDVESWANGAMKFPDQYRDTTAHAKTLSKYEPLPDPVEECLEKAHAAWVTRPDTLSLANVLATALRDQFDITPRSAGLVKS